MAIIRVGVQAVSTSAGQVVDFDGSSFASALSVTNSSALSIQYSLDGGTTWASVSAGVTVAVGSVRQSLFRLRRGTAGAYPLPVDIDVEVNSSLSDEQVAGFNNGHIIDSDGAAFALSEAAPFVALTATGTAYTGACEFRGIKVRALVGGPQTATIYDATSATGTPIDTVVFNALGTWLWDRPSDVLAGAGGRRPCTTGVHVVFSGGTSRTVDVMVGAA